MDDTGLMRTETESSRVVSEDLSDSGFAPVAPTAPVGAVHLLRLGLGPALLSNPVEGALGVSEVGLGEMGVEQGGRGDVLTRDGVDDSVCSGDMSDGGCDWID